MSEANLKGSIGLGVFICLGLSILGYTLGSSLIRFKEYERTVTVKGLSEREMPANLALWPIAFSGASDDLGTMYSKLEADTKQVVDFLKTTGFDSGEINVSTPVVTDKLAQRYGGNSNVELRYTGSQIVTVHSNKVDLARSAAGQLANLGKKGIVFGGEQSQNTEFMFTKLNDIKPPMIEEATRKAREVAQKFASDSNSRLGKIRNANQGQFTITDRDSSTPHIKNVRVVATVEYYLSD